MTSWLFYLELRRHDDFFMSQDVELYRHDDLFLELWLHDDSFFSYDVVTIHAWVMTSWHHAKFSIFCLTTTVMPSWYLTQVMMMATILSRNKCYKWNYDNNSWSQRQLKLKRKASYCFCHIDWHRGLYSVTMFSNAIL